MDIENQVRETIARYGLLADETTLVIGVSGGPDSVCLLHLLSQIAGQKLKIHVGHLNHGIRGAEANRDAHFVQSLCEGWDVPCTIEDADIPALASAQHQSLEETARHARYRFLAELAMSLGGRTIAVAHHADDQVETVLMHLLRGSGLAGLRGMLPLTLLSSLRLDEEDEGKLTERYADVRLIRPLIDSSREAILAYNATYHLDSCLDRTNLDTTYFRNRLRHELIPYLETYNPNLRERIGHMAQALAGDYAVMEALVEKEWAKVAQEIAGQAVILDLSVFRALAPGLQRSLIRRGVVRLRASLRDLGWIHIEDALDMVRRGQVGAQATLPGGLMLTLDYGRMILAPEGWQPPRPHWPRVREPLPLSLPGTWQLPGCPWQVATQIIQREQLPDDWQENTDRFCAYLDADRLTSLLHLRPRQAGDRLIPLGLTHRQQVRALMINARIPRAERDDIPLLVSGEHIVWVVGWRIDARYAVTPSTQRIAKIQFRTKEKDAQDTDQAQSGQVDQ